jgi:hypothetical protein
MEKWWQEDTTHEHTMSLEINYGNYICNNVTWNTPLSKGSVLRVLDAEHCFGSCALYIYDLHLASKLRR